MFAADLVLDVDCAEGVAAGMPVGAIVGVFAGVVGRV